MEEQFLDASAIDGLDEFDLTGEFSENDIVDSENTNVETENTTPEEPVEQEGGENPLEIVETLEESIDDFTKEVLRLKGIKDPTKIKFEDESGAAIERNWNDLSTNEKLSIMTLEEDTDTDLEEEEAEFINMLRENNLTPSQYLQAFQNNLIQHILDNQPIVYEIDNLNDDELFALDLIEKLGEDNVSDEELQEALAQAKANETLYKKQVEALRTYYKDLENKRNYEAEQAQQAQLEQDYQNFSNSILGQIEGFTEVAGQEIELSIDDKNDLANYILTRDDAGQSDFYKDLQNPQTLTRAAFWMLKGPEIMLEMQAQILDAFKRGHDLGLIKSNSSPKPAAPKVVITPKTTTQQRPINNDASAAFGDDESYLYN